MRRFSNQRGAALIMLIGITAALAMLAATLVFVIANESKATAITRARTQSFYGGEAALDSAIQMTKVSSPMPTADTGTDWMTQADLAAAFDNAFPDGSTVTYRLYDNVPSVDFSDDGAHLVKYDSNGDKRMWVDALCTAPDRRQTKTRERVLVEQVVLPFAAALPKAVTYSDTGINLKGNSNIYAVKADGTAITDGSMPTFISAGGTYTPSMSGTPEVGRLTLNTNATLGAPSNNKQSLGIRVNGSVRLPTATYTSAPNHTIPNTGTPKYSNVYIGAGTVGFLSDYFDQAAQADLTDEAQEGGYAETAPTVPSAPTSWTSSGYTTISSTLNTTLTSTSSTTTYDATNDLVTSGSINSGNLTLSRGANTSTRTFNFQDLYVTGNLTLSGPVIVNCTSLYVGGTLTIDNTLNASAPTVTDALTRVWVNGNTATHTIKGDVNVSTTSSFYSRGALDISNSTSSAASDTFTQLYCVGNFSKSGLVAVEASSSLYSGGAITLTGPGSTAVNDIYGQIWSTGNFDLTGGLLNINTSSQYGSLYGGGNVTLTGPTSGTTTDYFSLIYTPATSSAKTLAFENNVNVKTAALSITCNFTISGATDTTVKDWLGHTYVYAKSSSSDSSLNRGTINWSGAASVTSRDWTHPADPPKQMWLGRYFSRTGHYDDEYGNIWVPGNSSTSVVFNSTAASTVLCPLLATTERTQVGGNITFGSRAAPMVFFYVCDNNGIYPQVIDWTNAGTYYGLMVINESTIDFSGDSTPQTPTVEGAVFAGCPYDPTVTTDMSQSDIVMDDYCSVAFNQTVVGNIATSSLKTTTTVTRTVPGSWQQLPVN